MFKYIKVRRVLLGVQVHHVVYCFASCVARCSSTSWCSVLRRVLLGVQVHQDVLFCVVCC